LAFWGEWKLFFSKRELVCLDLPVKFKKDSNPENPFIIWDKSSYMTKRKLKIEIA
jgi:hypothetical protein